MISRLGQAMPRFFAGGNIAGAGLQERLRTTIIALLGLVTAVGLSLVGIAFNQSWPDFIASPIPGAKTERVGEASIAADVVPTRARTANDHESPGSTRPGRQDAAPDRSSGLRVSSQHRFPATVPEDSPAPAPAPAGQGGPETPPPPAEPPASVVPQPAQGTAPVATSPPVSQSPTTASVPGKGKAKGHEKSHDQSAPSVPVVPTEPSTLPPPTAPPPADVPAPADDGPGNGHGHGYGHSK
jgi:hypothetical protein